MKTFQLFSVSSRPQLSAPASPFTTAARLITSISITALSIGLSPSLASDFGGNCLQRRLTNWELRLRSRPHTPFKSNRFFAFSVPPVAAEALRGPPCLSFWGSTQILTHTHTRTLQNKVERLAETTPRSLHLSAPPPSFPSLRLPSWASLQASLGSWVP